MGKQNGRDQIMTTYYYGDIEFGKFRIRDTSQSTPMAVIHNVKDVKEFDTPEQAWEYWTHSKGEFESYVGVDAIDENDVQYELVFKQHR
jgi:hypothetical protein